MKKGMIYFLMVVLPMLVCIAIDCGVGLPDKWNIVLYVISYGICSYFLGEGIGGRRIINEKRVFRICILVIIFSISGLFVVNNIEELIKSDMIRMFCQIGLSLLCAVSSVVLISIIILRKKDKSSPK